MFRHNPILPLARTVVCILLAAAAAQAQVTATRVNVHVNGRRCDELKNVFLVIDDVDQDNQWLPLDKDGTCHWTKKLGEGSSFSTKLSHFSLRADFARTDCHQAAPNEKMLAGDLEFDCCNDDPIQNVHVKIQPPMPVSYLRSVPRDPNVDRKRQLQIRAIDCTEAGRLRAGTGAIRAMQFSAESIYLQLGTRDPEPKTPGLLLNAIVANDGKQILSFNGMTFRLMVQRGKGKMRSAPGFSSNAITLDIKKLEALKFEQAEFEVIK